VKDRTTSIIIRPTPGLAPEQARNTRARALRYALDRYFGKQQAAEAEGDKDAKKEGT
jgi:hypothetical protein